MPLLVRENEGRSPNVIKRGNRYLLVADDCLRFTDMQQFVSPTMSLAKFLKTFSQVDTFQTISLHC